MKNAFSLVELLISLIVISVIAVSFVPLVSKRVNKNNISISSQDNKELTANCSSINEKCKLCYAGSTSCIILECPTGKKPNAAKNACENIVCPSGQYLSGNDCINCSTTFPNCEVCNKSACSSCKSGYRLVNGVCRLLVKPKQTADCLQFDGAIFVPTNSDGTGICMTKANVGDPDGPSIIFNSITTVAAGTSNTITPCPNNTACCWLGAQSTRTSPPQATDGTTYCNNSTVGNVSYAKTNGAKFDYQSCSRTVCNARAGQIACSQYHVGNTLAGDWGLLSYEELATLADIIEMKEPYAGSNIPSGNTAGKFSANTSVSVVQKYMGSYGLQLCDYSSGYGSPQCARYSNACKGGDGNNCYPNIVLGEGGVFASLNKGSLVLGCYRNGGSSLTCNIIGSGNGNTTIPTNLAFAGSVRCVLREYPE